jgi:alkanesulfonate monooxygenase SsuD/methylene tetrahydromethanopterin reductase-like flavin-dependent oxidoreductase (luciferase family)
VAEKESILFAHCEAVGRDDREIERTVVLRQPIIRDSRTDAERALRAVFAHNGSVPWADTDLVGTPDDIAERCASYIELGYRDLIFQFLAPFDQETMERLAHDVRPRLEGLPPSPSRQ